MANKLKLLFLTLAPFLLFSSVAIEAAFQGRCNINKIDAREPSYTREAEGGVSEFWDYNNDEFQCAGVSIHRHRLRQNALMLPSYNNAPVLVYVVQGRGMFGLMISGCPETYESPQEWEESAGEGGKRFRDRHQKIGHFNEGDIIAIPAGAAHWAYNNGDQELVLVALQDNANFANQLDQNPRSFFLAGNPQREQGQSVRRGRGGEHEFGNVFKGFESRLLSEIFQVNEETSRKLQGKDDNRGHLIIVEKSLQVLSPPLRGEEREYGGRMDETNGIEETICTARVRENIDRPSRADVYNPRSGRYSTANSFTLPILRFIGLSAARGVLHQNAIMSPHWFVNAHSIVYFTRGQGRTQVVNHRGEAVFDGEVREGQVLVVPFNFAVVKKASEQGNLEWVEFNTNHNAMINTLSGRTSAIRALPADVVAAAYQIPRDEAQRLKFSRVSTLFSSGRSSGRKASE